MKAEANHTANTRRRDWHRRRKACVPGYRRPRLWIWQALFLWKQHHRLWAMIGMGVGDASRSWKNTCDDQLWTDRALLVQPLLRGFRAISAETILKQWKTVVNRGIGIKKANQLCQAVKHFVDLTMSIRMAKREIQSLYSNISTCKQASSISMKK